MTDLSRFLGKDYFMLTTSAVRTTELPVGEAVPVLGQGTWHFAEDARLENSEITSLRLGIDLGMMLIDTAEMYADGGAEKLVGKAIAGRRDEFFWSARFCHRTRLGAGRSQPVNAALRRLGT